MCSQWVVYAVSFVLLIFPILDRSVWTAIGLKPAAPKVGVFSCWDKLRLRGELENSVVNSGVEDDQ